MVGAFSAFFTALALRLASLAILREREKRNPVSRSPIDHLSLEYSLDGLLSLCLSHLGLHVTLGHDLGEGGADDGTLELLRAASALLHGLLLDSLLVLPAVQHGPGDLARVPLHQVRLLALLVQEGEGLREEKQIQHSLIRLFLGHSPFRRP